MTSSKQQLVVLMSIGRPIALIVEDRGKLKTVSGTLKTMDEGANTITVELDDVKIEKTLSIDSIKSFDLTEALLKDAIALSRFSSYIDADGNQQHTMHQSSIPQQQPQQSGQSGQSKPAGNKPTLITTGFYYAEALIKKSSIRWIDEAFYKDSADLGTDAMQRTIIVGINPSASTYPQFLELTLK